VEAMDRALKKAKREKSRPTLICAKTVIAKGAPTKAGTGGAHGAALGEKEVAATREAIGWSHPPFEVPERIRQAWDAREAGKRAERRNQAPGVQARSASPHGPGGSHSLHGCMRSQSCCD